MGVKRPISNREVSRWHMLSILAFREPYALRLAGALRSEPAAEQVIHREGPRSPRQQEEKDGSPDEVLVPGLWIDEELDGNDLPEQRERGESGGEPHDQERGAAKLDRGGHDRSDGGRQHRHLVLAWNKAIVDSQLANFSRPAG